uniref:Uncharacterized protein n=1 Tax=Oryza nivara TaxID=4536 RepID=A0A0E0H4J9_ORYNI
MNAITLGKLQSEMRTLTSNYQQDFPDACCGCCPHGPDDSQRLWALRGIRRNNSKKGMGIMYMSSSSSCKFKMRVKKSKPPQAAHLREYRTRCKAR